MKEFDLIEMIRRSFESVPAARGLVLPIGDDCSVLRPPNGKLQVTTADSLVDGNHFVSSLFRPGEIGRKAMRVNLSDLASMGAQGPYYAWLTLVLSPRLESSFLKGLVSGIRDDCVKYGVTLAGGNVTRANEFSIHLTLSGWVEPKKLLKRKGARPGDLICITGTVGPSTMAYKRFKAGKKPEPFMLKRWANPTPRMEEGIALAKYGIASSCIDISDGVFQDLGHVVKASGVGADLYWEKLPIEPRLKKLNPSPADMGFGEDYELMFTVPPSRERYLKKLKCPVAVVGKITRKGFRVLDESGGKVDISGVGWEVGCS